MELGYRCYSAHLKNLHPSTMDFASANLAGAALYL